MFHQTISQMGFWLTWLLIPFIVDALPTLASCLRLFFKKRNQRPLPTFLPQLAIIVPVFNSEKTLAACLHSIAASDYPTDHLVTYVVDNGSSDHSFQVFARCQAALPQLRMRWMQTQAGKATALNAAIYQADAPFIINIDSDGRLEKHALRNVIRTFHNNPQLAALTGAILTDRSLIKRPHRLLKLNEYFEYCQAFLAGRNLENEHGQLFTLSGAFSAFRKTTMTQSFLYSTNTLSEDTDMTFQIRYKLHAQPGFCPDAIFYTAPISGWNQLYTQRQRWQRGEMEVVHRYLGAKLNFHHFFNNFQVRRLIVDHTVNLLKTIWLGAILILPAFGYSWQSPALSYFLIYCLYLSLTLATACCVTSYLHAFKQERRFYLRHLRLVLLQPCHNFCCSLIRCVGIINFYTGHASWRGTSLRQEGQKIKTVVKSDCRQIFQRRNYDD